MPSGVYVRTKKMNTGKYKRSEETKRKISLAAKGNQRWLGKKHTEESKKKISIYAKERIRNKNPFYGRHHSNESKQKIRLTKLGKPNLLLRGKPKSEETKKKISEIKKKLYSEGKISTWNRGLTKETDERVLKGAINMIGKNAGEKCHTFNNWSSLKPYTKEFNEKFKKYIKERDGCCMLCNIGIEDLKYLNKQIHIHHIDYNKLNSFIENCITLCNSCHTKTNFNRNQWKLFFKSLLRERYGYKYSTNQKVIYDFNYSKGGVEL